MATLEELLDAEHQIRLLLVRNDLPHPNRIEYELGTIWLHWSDRRLVVAIDVDERPPEELSELESAPE